MTDAVLALASFLPHALGWRLRCRAWHRHPQPQQVLLYHSVSTRSRDPLLLAVSAERFEAHIAWLAKNTDLLPLAEWVDRAEAGRLPKRAVAVTFDDAYADNFSAAAPVLARHRATGTVFVATELVGSPREPWWEEADALLLETPDLPDRLELGGQHWSIEPRLPEGRASWTVLEAPVTLREHAYLGVLGLLKHSTVAQREMLLEALRTWAGGARPARPERRIATVDTLREAHAGGVLTLGAHTRRHPCLSALDRPAQHEEIAGSRADLAAWLGAAPDFFAYPFGTYSDFTPCTARLAREAGFRASFANMAAAPRPGGPRHDWPRLCVMDWPVEELARRLGL